ncbi:TPA: transcription antiterminator [Bacillus thuringiensis]|nr:helix-turn-helix domain-containing protein [Bacillus cereus]HDR4799434.1 helix-turn-helix domain-containing protein [Bacillus cereus]HDR4805571.1 helix-turn-helix domain-containing protein [Bacillus cereus]HDR4811511.1 helix-turn-helix domain-containing protein [Bacillus cereus]HDR4833984.1 helix-turn-helix domain-containing protein [Bacillus cereus]
MYDSYIEDLAGFRIELQSEIKRRINLMKLISTEKRWYTFDEISTFINTSSKTISRDLSFIQDLLPRGWRINVRKGYGVQLILPMHAMIEEIICIFFRESLTFNILDRLMKNSETTIKKLTEELHIQPSAISKALKKIEKDLAYYDLKLQRKPIKVIGDEWKIIFMFTSLYTKAYVNLEWPFQYKQDLIFTYIKEIENALGVVLYLSGRYKLSYFVAIMLMRKQQGFEIQWVDDFLQLNVDTPYFKKISMYLEEIQSKENITFSIPEKIILTMMFKCLNFIYRFPKKEKENDIRIFHNQKIPIYNILRDFIELLYARLEENFIKEDEFAYSMITHFRKNIYRLHFYNYVERSEKYTTKFIKETYFKTFTQVKDIYIKWIKKHQIAIHVPDDEIVNIVVYIESQRMKQQIKSKKAIIVTKEGDCWRDYISAQVKRKFGNKIEFPDLISINIANGLKLEENYDIDFILSTTPLKQQKHPVIMIQPIITERDIYNIKKYIDM